MGTFGYEFETRLRATAITGRRTERGCSTGPKEPASRIAAAAPPSPPLKTCLSVAHKKAALIWRLCAFGFRVCHPVPRLMRDGTQLTGGKKGCKDS